MAGTTSMKLSEWFSRPVPSVLVFVLYGSCLGMLTLAFERLPVSVAYTVWGSVGTVLVVVVARVVFDEHLSPFQIASIALVILGVIGLNLGRADEDAGAVSAGSVERVTRSVDERPNASHDHHDGASRTPR